MVILYIFAIIGVIASVAVLLAVVGSISLKKPELPLDLFEDCRVDLRQLQDWYFSQGLYKETDKTSEMLKSLDDLWAAHDMKSDEALSD